MFSTGSMLGGAADKFKVVSWGEAQRSRAARMLQVLCFTGWLQHC
jgi:hypothetical protein